MWPYPRNGSFHGCGHRGVSARPDDQEVYESEEPLPKKPDFSVDPATLQALMEANNLRRAYLEAMARVELRQVYSRQCERCRRFMLPWRKFGDGRPLPDGFTLAVHTLTFSPEKDILCSLDCRNFMTDDEWRETHPAKEKREK